MLKFDVKDAKHSKQIQDAIFALGGGWNIFGELQQSQEYHHTDKPFLFLESIHKLDDSGEITDEKTLNLSYGELVPEEYNFADFVSAELAKSMQTSKPKIIDVTLNNFKDYFHEINFKTQYLKSLA